MANLRSSKWQKPHKPSAPCWTPKQFLLLTPSCVNNPVLSGKRSLSLGETLKVCQHQSSWQCRGWNGTMSSKIILKVLPWGGVGGCHLLLWVKTHIYYTSSTPARLLAPTAQMLLFPSGCGTGQLNSPLLTIRKQRGKYWHTQVTTWLMKKSLKN